MRVRAPRASNVSDTASTHATGTPARGARREQRRGLHLDGERVGVLRALALAGLVEQVDADDRAQPAPRGVRSPARRSAPASALARSPAPSAREVPSAQIASRAITSSPSASPPTSAPQVPTRIARRTPSAISSREHDRRRRAAHAGRLDRQRLAVGRRAGVAPQAAVVVEHARLDEQRLRQRERAPGIAGQQHALGERRGRVQVDGVAVRHRRRL